MEKLSFDQALEMAKAFKAAGNQVGQLALQKWEQLTPKERRDFNAWEWSLASTSEDMLSLAGKLSGENLQDDIDAIVAATNKAKKAVKVVGNVKKAITITAALATLGAAVMSKDAGAVIKALGGLLDEIKPPARDENQ